MIEYDTCEKCGGVFKFDMKNYHPENDTYTCPVCGVTRSVLDFDQVEKQTWLDWLFLRYSEKYGIIDYTVKGNCMTYYCNYMDIKPYTVKCTVKVIDGKCKETRQRLKRLNRAGYYNY